MKLTLDGVAETLLIPFYARVYGSLHYKEKFYDEKAVEAFPKIDYDFSKYEKSKLSIWGCISRSIILDREAKKVINKFPNIKCISIGCGFDSRFNRIDNKKITWYGIDFPEVIDFREKIFPINDREKYIKANALDEIWAKDIRDENETLIILEGILMFFKEDEVKKIFSILRKYFPKAIILTEFSSPFFIKNQKYHDAISKTKAQAYWGIKNSREIEKLCPEVKFIKEWNLTKGMLQFSPILLTCIYPIIYKINNKIVKLEMK